MERRKEIKGVLFDLDGVLTDTEGLYTIFWDHIGREVYPANIPDFARAIKGTTLPVILNRYFPLEAHQDIRQRLAEYERTMTFVLYPGALDFLRDLKRDGMKVAIVTSSGDVKMRRLLDEYPALKSLIGALVTDSKVTRSKPHPEPYLIGAKELGLTSEECVVFEDSLIGVKAGKSSGAFTIGVATGNPKEALKAAGADACIYSLADMTVQKMLELL